ncbi:ISAs1 family transposase, partial [Azotobacter beijerinckii]
MTTGSASRTSPMRTKPGCASSCRWPTAFPHTPPSDIIGRLERKAFAEALARWMQDSLPSLDARYIALDGKLLRGSRQNGSAVHLMSAFATEARLVLAQHEVPGKANEITALPDL